MVGESGLFTPADIGYVQEAGCKAVSIVEFRIQCPVLFLHCLGVDCRGLLHGFCMTPLGFGIYVSLFPCTANISY